MADLIDRQSVVDIVMCYCPDDDGSCSKADVDIRELLDEIENLPAVNHWIPCSEQLPEKCIRCLVITEKGDYGISRYMSDGRVWCCFRTPIVHWMPLPEHPENGGVENGY